MISDIHGCYKEFLTMLEKIDFSNRDYLIMAGDYIDRGKYNYEMLKWLEHCPRNVVLVRGNHEEEFVKNIDLMFQLDKKEELASDFTSNKDAIILYESVKYILKQKYLSALYFDLYGTLNSLLAYSNVTLEDFSRWTEIIHKMPYYFKLKVGDRNCVVVHAGYTEKLEDINSRFSSLEEFYLYAREEGYQLGGKQHGMIIAGHTPTISKKSFAYNKGKVFQYYNREMDCIFYNIDCGCVFQEWELDARLACIRLEDEKVFYV